MCVQSASKSSLKLYIQIKKALIRRLKYQIKCNSMKKTLTVTNANNKLKEFKIICFVMCANLLPFTVIACRSITIYREISVSTARNAEFYCILMLILMNNFHQKILVQVLRVNLTTMLKNLSINALIVKLKNRFLRKLKN